MLWFSLGGESSLISHQVDAASKFNNCEVQINHCCQCRLRLYSFKTVKFKQQYFYPASRQHGSQPPATGLECLPRAGPHSWLSVGKWGRRKQVELQPQRWPIHVTERLRKLKVNNSLSCRLCVRFHPWAADGKEIRLWHLIPAAPLGLPTHYLWSICLPARWGHDTKVHDSSWKFHRFKLSQDWEDNSFSSPRFFPIKYGAFLAPPINPRYISCKMQESVTLIFINMPTCKWLDRYLNYWLLSI